MPQKNSNMPPILHINTEKGFRGGEVQTLEIAKRLRDKGYPTLLMCRKQGMLCQKAIAEGLETMEFSPRGELDILSALKIKKTASQFGARIVHAHTSQALGLVYLSRVRRQAAASSRPGGSRFLSNPGIRSENTWPRTG